MTVDNFSLLTKLYETESIIEDLVRFGCRVNRVFQLTIFHIMHYTIYMHGLKETKADKECKRQTIHVDVYQDSCYNIKRSLGRERRLWKIEITYTYNSSPFPT